MRSYKCNPRLSPRGSVVPSEDQHSSEYLAACDARRAYISGFTGSSGLAVIPATGKAQLFTDGRYFLQASQQLDDNWNLQKQGLKGVPTWQKYLEKVRCGQFPCVFLLIYLQFSMWALEVGLAWIRA